MGCISQINHVYQIKSIKQKQLINGLVFALQEIYGIEKKCSSCGVTDEEEPTLKTEVKHEDDPATESVSSSASCSVSDHENGSKNEAKQRLDRRKKKFSPSKKWNGKSVETEDTITSITTSSMIEIYNNSNNNNNQDQDMKGIECVICMCESRDTLILPCRHLCLCKLCAINLRVQSNNCPICRIPFVALIQLKLFKKKNNLEHNQLPCIKLDALNNQVVTIEDEVNTEITTTSASGADSAGCGAQELATNSSPNEENVIVKIKQIRKGGDCKNSENRLVMSEQTNNKNNVNFMRKLSDYYDCVTIYEAFDYRELNSNSNLNNNLEVYKQIDLNNKAKGAKKKKVNSAKKTSQSNEKAVVKTFNNINNNLRSCSVIVGSCSAVVGAVASRDTIKNISNSNTSTYSKSKSVSDVRKAEEISLEKITDNSSSNLNYATKDSQQSENQSLVNKGRSNGSLKKQQILITGHKVSCSEF